MLNFVQIVSKNSSTISFIFPKGTGKNHSLHIEIKNTTSNVLSFYYAGMYVSFGLHTHTQKFMQCRLSFPKLLF